MESPQHAFYPPSLGARMLGDRQCEFRVWAPKAKKVELSIRSPRQMRVPMTDQPNGYFTAVLDDVAPGTRYFYRLDGGQELPDPASRFQPEGVHGPSEVVNRRFAWTDGTWRGLPLRHFITYELHVGTFTQEGTFDAVIGHLDELVELGITAIELMPVSQFPGGRNWGYDGVFPFAVQNTYGGPEGLKRLVNACHQRGLAIILDVVYNHLGPEGNYLPLFGDYFTSKHKTVWGDALNFDGPNSDEVRRYFIESALYFIGELHFDALRLDAIFAIFDFSAYTFLQELADSVRIEGERTGRRCYTIAESALNDPRTVTPGEEHGVGIDAQWCDDLHHSLYLACGGDRIGYYEDYEGFPDLVRSYCDPFVINGRYAKTRGCRHGRTGKNLAPERIIVCGQNHDQVGNRLLGERITELFSLEVAKLSAAAVILSPYQPLLFMGEEFGETARFQYFISHEDPELVDAVRRGRREEFASFKWEGDVPDPQSEETFQNSKLHHELKHAGHHCQLREYYRALLKIRRTDAACAIASRDRMDIFVPVAGSVLAVRRWSRDHHNLLLLNFAPEPTPVEIALPEGTWKLALDSAAKQWNGPGSQLPSEMQIQHQAALTLPAQAAVVYQCDLPRCLV